MALFEQLVGATLPKIGVHGFCGSLRFAGDGVVTLAAVRSEYGVTGQEHDADFTWLTGKYAAATDKVAFIRDLEDLLILAEEDRFGLRARSTFAAAVDAVA